MRLYENNVVKAFDDVYDFDYKPWSTHPIRNVLNFIGATIHGWGMPFEVDFTGSATIKENPSFLEWYLQNGGLR